nr:unnamed protein product [Digitaria exilis]
MPRRFRACAATASWGGETAEGRNGYAVAGESHRPGQAGGLGAAFEARMSRPPRRLLLAGYGDHATWGPPARSCDQKCTGCFINEES